MGDEDLGSICGWSWEENKIFEMALALIDEGNPNRWKEIAAIIGGKKSVEEIKKHYEKLLEDLDVIEAGVLDQDLAEGANCNQLVNWTDNDHKLFKQLSIKDYFKGKCSSDHKIQCSSNL